MKRIFPIIGTALLACAASRAAAFETEAVLDQFPTSRTLDVRIVQDVRRGARTEQGRAVRDGRDGGYMAPRYRSHGSIIEVSALGGSVERGAFYGTAGTAQADGGIIVINTGADLAALSAAIHSAIGGGAKILDIETDRLDRRPYGPDGLDVVHAGSAKIIRISPDFGRTQTQNEPVAAVALAEPPPAPVAYVPPAAVYPDTDMTDRPVDPPAAERRASVREEPVAAPEPDVEAPAAEARQAEMQVPEPVSPAPAATPEPARPHLEPWTPEWLRDCVGRHSTFDASLGTYVGEDGQRRFCTGEP